MKKAEFFNCVYEIVAGIPTGKVMTYGQIAMILGSPRWARQVGQAMYNTPEYLDIPSHRVVNSKGELAPAYAFGGQKKQRQILENEGILFKENGSIDLKKCLWKLYE
jgi:methylated-DNA-protein-cysteine methyltransferase-like protein